MTGRPSSTGFGPALLLVGVVLLSVPAGLAAVGGSAPAGGEASALPTVTPPSIVNGTATEPTPGGGVDPSTPTAAPTATDDGRTLVVDSGILEECPTAEYERIQPAIQDAARGDTVRVCPGSYDPFVVDTPNVRLQGSGNPLVEGATGPLVRIDAARVTLDGFRVRAEAGAETAVVVGAPMVVVRNTTVEATTLGIVLGGEGAEPGGTDVAPATRSHLVATNVSALDVAVWSGADRARIANNDLTTRARCEASPRGCDPTGTAPTSTTGTAPTSTTGTFTAGMHGGGPGVPIAGIASHRLNEGPRTNGTGLAVGGLETDIEGNTVESVGTGVVVGDGTTPVWGVDPSLGAATGSQLADNTVRAESRKVWVDADGTVLTDNLVTVYGRCDTNHLYPPEECEANGIASSGNDTVIRDNTVEYPQRSDQCPPCNWTKLVAAIKIGVTPLADHNMAADNLVEDNTVTGPRYANGISLIRLAENALVRENTVSEAEASVIVVGNASNRTIRDNTLGGGEGGLHVLGPVEIRDNEIHSQGDGVHIETPGNVHVTLVANTITGNPLRGVFIDSDSFPSTFHIRRNVIRNNGGLGMQNENYFKTNDKWPIVNATHNYWGCGGPSSGLRDPYTDAVADGSGDGLSAGDEPGYANVHFDPYLQRSVCPQPAPATETPTDTPTSTPTLTPTHTPSPTAGVGLGDGNATDDSDGNVTDGSGSDGSATGGSDGGTDGGDDGSADDAVDQSNDQLQTPTPPPTPPQTPTPTPVASPTPRVEPGFGVLAWVVGVIVLTGLVTARRRVQASREEER